MSILQKSLFIGSLAGLVVFVIYTLWLGSLITQSDSSTALLGWVDLVFVGIPLSIIALVFTGASTYIVISVKNKFITKKTIFVFILSILIVSGILLLGNVVMRAEFLPRKVDKMKNSEEILAYFKYVSDKHYIRFVEESIMISIANNIYTPPELLSQLSDYDSLYVLSNVAMNGNTPPETLFALMEKVPHSVALNPSLNSDHVLKLWNDYDSSVHGNLVNNENIQDVLDSLDALGLLE